MFTFLACTHATKCQTVQKNIYKVVENLLKNAQNVGNIVILALQCFSQKKMHICTNIHTHKCRRVRSIGISLLKTEQ